MTTGFRAKIFTSAKLSSLQFASSVGLRLISTLVLTRLLAPDVYGVFAVVLLYLYLLEMFSDLGVRSLVLTKEGDVSDDFLRTCWTVTILRGVLIATVSAIISLTIALLQAQGQFAPENPYASVELPWAIAALGLTAFVHGMASPMRFMVERDMAFGRVTIVDVTRDVVALVVTIALAFYLRSVWALVLGNVAKTVVHVSFSYVVFPGPAMRLRFNRAELGLVINRGKWILSHSALTAISLSADRLVLGFVMSSSTFGFYFIARQLVDMVTQFMGAVSGQMGLQVFTHLHKSSAADFRRNYYRYRLFFDAVGGLAAGGMIMLAPLAVDIIFDDRYGDIAPFVQILALAILVQGPMLLREAFSAERRFRDMTMLSVVSALTLWIGLGVAILGFASVNVALGVIAFYRLPEALIITVMGYKREWFVLWRETLRFVFCAVGAGIGWGIVLLWEALV